MPMIIGATALRAAARLLLLLAFALAAASSFFVPEAAAQKRIYVSVDDHTDYMWRTDEAGYQDAFLQMLDYYLNAADTTAANPPQLQSRFNTDGTFWIWTYERNKPATDFDRLISRVKDGHIGVPLNALVSTYGAQPAEAVLRGMYYAGRLERRYGLRFPLVEAMENQTLPYGVGMLWSGAGARYSWRGVCGCVSHVFSLSRREHEIYHWAGADGTTLLMKWNSMLENNASIGGYAEARDPAHAITFLDTDPTFQSLYPYAIIGAFGKGWDDVMTTDLATVTAAQSNTTAQRQVIVSNEVDFFQDFEQTYGATLPQVALGFGNEWDVYSASMPELSAAVRRSVEKLRSAEALASLVALQNPAFLDGRTAARDDAFMALGLYWEHDWTADGWIARSDRALWQRKIAGQITSYVDALQNDAAAALGGMIANGSANPRFYVFNALSWARTDIADFAYAGAGPVHVVDVSTSSEVPSQLVTVDGQQRLRILAGNVPPVGYKVFEIQAGAGAVFAPAATTGVNTIENNAYRIVLGANGAISSLIDKTHNNREVVRTVNGRTINDLGLGNATFSIENAGPVSVTLKAVVDAPLAHETRITLSALDRIDVRNDITQGFSGVFTWAYGFGINAPVTRHEEVGAVVRAAKAADGGIYSGRNARYDWLTLNHFADMSETTDDFGVTLSSADLSFMQLGQSQSLFLDTATPQISVLAGGQIDGPGWGIPDQGGDTHFLQRFAMRTHGAYDAAAAMRFSLEHQNPLVAAPVSGGSAYPASTYSFLTVSDPNVLLWSLKPADDGIANGLVARFWNLGTNGGFTATTPLPIASAERTTHIETPLTAAQLSAGSLVANANPQQMVTYRFVLGQAAPPPPPPPPPGTDPTPTPAPAALPTLSIADVTVTEPDEGTINATFVVTLSEASSQTVVVTYATADGTALKTVDYTARSGALIFPPGALTRSFTVPVIGDRVHEPTKTFTVNLSSPSNATIARGQAIGTIIDNDPDALVGFQLAQLEVSESGPGATVVVARTGSKTAAFTVQYETVDATAHAGVDYVATTGTLTFPAGVMTRSIALKVLPNTKMDGRRTLMLRLFNVSAQAGLDRSTLPVTITDDDVGGVIRFSSAVYNVNEGAGLATITVVRTGGAASAVTVDYATAAPTSGVAATAGTDFTAVSGTLTFAAGQTSRTFTIPIVKDTIDEPNETVGLVLSNVTGGATLGTPSAATLTIMDDDVGGVIQFAATAMTVVEGKQASIVVTRTGGLAGPVTVDWVASHISTNAADFSPASGTLTFAAGITSQTIVLTVNDDGIDEGPEQFVLALGNATGAATIGARRNLLVTVNDKQLTQPTIHFSTPVYSVTEGGVATIVVRRSGPTTGKVTVDYATSDGTATVADGDYTARSGTLTFNPGVTAMSFTVPTTNDSRVEGDEQLGLTLSNVTGGTLGTQRTAKLIILDNDVGGVIRFSSAVYSVGENAGVATITVVRTGGAAGPVTVDYATGAPASGSAATAGTDFTAVSGTLTFGPGQTVRTFTIPIAADTIDEQNETVGLVLSNVTGGAVLGSPNKATLTILDDDTGGVIQFAATTMSVVEGGQANIVVTRTGGLAGPVTVNWNAIHLSTDASDFSPVTGTLTFAAGVTSQPIVLTIPDDGVEEGPEKFVLVLSSPTGAATLGARQNLLVTINDKTLTQPTIHFIEPVYNVVEGGIATITLRRSGPTAGKVTVNYATSDGTATIADGDYTARTGTLTFAPGVTAASFTVPTTADTRVEGDQLVHLTLSNVTGGRLGTQQTANLIIRDNDIGGIIRFSAPVYTVSEGAKLATITVTRTGGAASGVSVDYTATTPLVGIPAVIGTDFTAVTGTLTFAAGQTSRTFTVPILQDTVDEPAKDVRLVLSNVQGGAVLAAPSTAKISITDDDVAGNVRFAATSWSASRDALTVTVKLVRTGGTSSDARVQYATVNGSAVAGTDFTQTAGTVIFAANETEKLITVPLISNAANLDVRSFSIALGVTLNGLTLGTPAQATVFLVAPH